MEDEKWSGNCMKCGM